MKACFVCRRGSTRLDYTYSHDRIELFRERLDLLPEIIHEDNLTQHQDFLREVEVILATWDMIPFTAEQLAVYFPKLKILFYAAGSVQYFARPFLQRGIRIVSAWGIMCKPVAQFTYSCMILANKGAFSAARLYSRQGYQPGHVLATQKYPGTYEIKVGILGAGMIGGRVIEMLKATQTDVEILVYDPFISQERAETLGVRLAGLEEVFRSCQTISNHMANNPQTTGILNYDLFKLMKPNAAFINTGRGAQVVEPDLIRALQEQPLRQAILDVTWPEPVAADHPFLSMPNIMLFPHVAGHAAHEVHAFVDCMFEQLINFQKDNLVDYEVTLSMLSTMA